MKRLAVLGHPVAHSRSPAMQNAALEELGLGKEWSYEAIDVEPERFADRVRELPGEDFVGVNVTIPHKEAALAVADDASAAAGEIGAANTFSFTAEGIRADNTDAPGLIAALPRPPTGLSALVLGAGGSGRAAVWALAHEGARVSVWNRTVERANQLAADLMTVLEHKTGRTDIVIPPVSYEQARAGVPDLIVNCTAVGMPGTGDPFEQLPIDPEDFASGPVVVDLVYSGSDTDLVRVARERGAPTVDGLEVLVRQGGESLRIWTGEEPPLEAMREAARSG